jgi:chromosome segregation ATPase
LPRAYSLPSDPRGNGTGSAGSSQNELARLIEISAKLAELNETLRNELADSRKNSAELSNTLVTSKNELDALRTELESLRRTSAGLLSKAELSSQESSGLREALKRAESSLTNLERSFGAYRMTAESRIASLEKSGRLFKYASIAGAVLAIAGWTAFAAVNARR